MQTTAPQTPPLGRDQIDTSGPLKTVELVRLSLGDLEAMAQDYYCVAFRLGRTNPNGETILKALALKRRHIVLAEIWH